MNALFPISIGSGILTFSLIPFFIVFSALFPARLARTMLIATRMPVRSFTIGMVNFLFFLATALAQFILAAQVGGLLKALLTFPALVVSFLLSIGLIFSLVSMANVIGERIAPAQSGWRRTLWGTLLLGLSCSAPLIGWSLLLPYITWMGLGAFIISLFQKKDP